MVVKNSLRESEIKPHKVIKVIISSRIKLMRDVVKRDKINIKNTVKVSVNFIRNFNSTKNHPSYTKST